MTDPDKEIAQNIVSYIEEHEINLVVKRAVNKTLKEKPDDPLSSIAASLISQAKHSYPCFESI